MFSIEAKVNPNSDYYFHMPSPIAKKLYLYPIVLGEFFYDVGYQIARNHHNSFLIMYIDSGAGYVHQQDLTLSFSTGDFVFLDCHISHEYSFSKASHVYWIHFDGTLAANYYDLITSSYGNILQINSPYNVLHSIKKIIETYRSQKTIKEVKISSYLTNILNEFLDKNSYTSSNYPQAKNIDDSISYIQEHFNSPVTLELLADISNLSPYYFTRIFTSETGMTPHQYLIATRINAAKFYLRSQSLSIKEIAFNCGFNSESSFCSTFKKWENITPSEYRNLCI